MTPDTPASPPAPKKSGQIRIAKSLLQRAVHSDQDALSDIFSQFLGADEKVIYADYLGVDGMWGVGKKSFGCLTNRRIAGLRVGAFKEIIYSDGYLEFTNSGIIYQPSKLALYVMLVIATLGALYLGAFFASVMSRVYDVDITEITAWGPGVLLAIALTLLFWIVAARLFYRFSKCGLVWWIREGVPVYVFSNRSMLTRANHLYRLWAEARDQRIKAIREPL